MTNAADTQEITSKWQAHGRRRGAPCRNAGNPCKINKFQWVAQAPHAQAACLRKLFPGNRSKNVGETRISAKEPATQQLQWGRAGPRVHYADPSPLRGRMSGILGKNKGNQCTPPKTVAYMYIYIYIYDKQRKPYENNKNSYNNQRT